MIILAYILSGFSLAMMMLFFIRQKVSIGFLVLFPKLFASALAAYWAIIGAVGAVLGLVYQTPWAILMGAVSSVCRTSATRPNPAR